MRSISFAWVSPAFVAKRKHCTRREWDKKYALSFKKGEQLFGLDKVYFAGGHRIGSIVLTEPPYEEPLEKMPDSDFEQEGFAYLEEIKHPLPKHWIKAGCKTWRDAFEFWRKSNNIVWVLRFAYKNEIGLCIPIEQQLSLFKEHTDS